MPFRSRAVRSLVELHEHEIRSFLQVWKQFVGAGLTRVGEWVGRPVNDVDAGQDPVEIASRAPAFADEVLGAYRRHLAEISTEELERQVHRTR